MISVGDRAPNLTGQPVFGVPFDLDRVRTRGSVVVAFWSALSSAGTLANLAALTALWPQVDTDGGGLVVLTRSPLETARDFVPRHHVLFPMIVDDTGEIFKRWGVGRAKGLGSTFVRFRPEPVRRMLSVIRNGQPLPEAHVDQLPAAFAVGADARVRYAWLGTTVDARIDVEALWTCARD